MNLRAISSVILALVVFSACMGPEDKSAQEILGHPDYKAIAYGGYRNVDRAQAPTVADIKEDLQILDAMGIRILRTYHARLYDHTPNLLKAIREMKESDPSFEMYVMLGAWMQCEGAWTDQPNHLKGDEAENRAEIEQAIALAKAYPDIVKIIAVGNEAMVHWAASYYVHPRIILKEVLALQALKAKGELPADLWITSSDNFASWGGGDASYQVPALDSLIEAVDYLSVHSYPFHDTHYNPEWWWMPEEDDTLVDFMQVKMAVDRGVERLIDQLEAVHEYQVSLGVKKPMHLGETGWASADNVLYGAEGSRAADEYKQTLYYLWIRRYCEEKGMACFYFEAFDEPWKDGTNPGGSENHFGLIGTDGLVKMPLWKAFDEGRFDGLSRGGKPLRKSHGGNEEMLVDLSQHPPKRSEQPALLQSAADSAKWLFAWPNDKDRASFERVQYMNLNAWEASCELRQTEANTLLIEAGAGDWWGASLSLKEAIDLSAYAEGYLEISLKGSPETTFEIGWQSGLYEDGSQQNASIAVGAGTEYPLNLEEWQTYRIPMENMKAETNLKDVRAPLYVRGLRNVKGARLEVWRATYQVQ